MADEEVVFTPKQRAYLTVLFHSVHVLLQHAANAATGAKTGYLALRNLLTERGVVTEEEWDAAVTAIETQQATLLSLDPEYQEALAKIQSVYPWFGRGEGPEIAEP